MFDDIISVKLTDIKICETKYLVYMLLLQSDP